MARIPSAVGSTSSAPPPSALLVAWGNAWLAGHCGVDEVADLLEEPHGPQRVTSLDDPTADVPLRQALGELRTRGLTAFRLALPVPGDPLGLPGPASFNAEAVDAGQAVLVDLADAPVGLVPVADARGTSYQGLRWVRHLLAGPSADTPSLAEAEQHLKLTLSEAADALLALDVASWHPEAATALAQIRRGTGDDAALAPGYPQRAHRVAAQATRLAAISAFGLADDSGTVTGWEADARRTALRDLERAVRRARVAAYNSVTERPHG